MAINRAQLLVSSFRPPSDIDAKTFSKGIAEILVFYPDEVMISVTHPRMGLAARLKYFPTYAEVKEACEEAMAPVYAERKRQIENTRMLELTTLSCDPEDPETRERVVAAWEAVRDVVKSARPFNETAKKELEPPPPRETPEQALERLARDKTPVLIGAEMRAKLDAMAAQNAARGNPEPAESR